MAMAKSTSVVARRIHRKQRITFGDILNLAIPRMNIATISNTKNTIISYLVFMFVGPYLFLRHQPIHISVMPFHLLQIYGML
jgi:hypothetical protein